MGNPFGDAAGSYWSAGWRGILPLPHGQKKNPPAGHTGATGTDPSYPDIATWADGRDGPRNICLRLPEDIIGIDVDAYGDKQGAQTLADAEQRWGQLPATWRTTSRDDGISGIRLFRVPPGLAWPGQVGAGIETVRHDHRYALVWPSLHPEGRTYRWIDPDGVTAATGIPDPDLLPMLPHDWVIGLTGGELATKIDRNDLAEDAAVGWIMALPHANGTPCARMTKAIDQTKRDIDAGAHDGATAGAARVLRLGYESHPGTIPAITAIRDYFVGEVTNPNRAIAGKTLRDAREASKEWRDIVRSGVNLISAQNRPDDACDCDGHLTAAILTDDDDSSGGEGENASPGDDDTATGPVGDGMHAPNVHAGGGWILDAPEAPPALWGFGDEVLWAKGESLMVVGPPGVGKTTLVGQLLRGRLGLQDALLGWGVTATQRRVLYLAMDRPQQIARALRRHFNEDERDHLDDKLAVWPGPPPADMARNTNTLLNLAVLADADTVIIDSVKDAAIGLSEDEVGAGYNRARQVALAAGIEIVELHHQTKRGPNGSKPTSLADVYGSAWITAGAGSVLMLWGQAGDMAVEMHHLKQPAADVGPLLLIHDHTAGVTRRDDDGVSLEDLLVANPHGLSARSAAIGIERNTDPTKAQMEKARRRLDGMVDQGLARREAGRKGGDGNARKPALWFPIAGKSQSRANHEMADSQSRANHAEGGETGADLRKQTNHGQSRQSRSQSREPITQSGTANHAKSAKTGADLRKQANHAPITPITEPITRSTPSLDGGACVSPSAGSLSDELLKPCEQCSTPTVTQPCSHCKQVDQ